MNINKMGAKEIEVICPHCKNILYYLENETLESVLPCPQCGWNGGETEVPEDIIIPLNRG